MGIARVVVVAIARNQIRPSCGTVRPCPLRSASSSTNEFVLIGGGWRRSRSSRVRAPLPKFTMLIYSWFLLNGTVDCYLCDGGGVSREVMGPVSVVGRVYCGCTCCRRGGGSGVVSAAGDDGTACMGGGKTGSIPSWSSSCSSSSSSRTRLVVVRTVLPVMPIVAVMVVDGGSIGLNLSSFVGSSVHFNSAGWSVSLINDGRS